MTNPCVCVCYDLISLYTITITAAAAVTAAAPVVSSGFSIFCDAGSKDENVTTTAAHSNVSSSDTASDRAEIEHSVHTDGDTDGYDDDGLSDDDDDGGDHTCSPGFLAGEFYCFILI